MSESGVVHFTVGEDAGMLLMQIAQEHLIYNNDVEKALKTITDSLTGCPMDLALKILVGDYVIEVDVEDQQFMVDERDDAIHTIFPKIDVFKWCRDKSIEIAQNGKGLKQAIDEIAYTIKHKSVKVNYSYEQIFEFIAGNNNVILEDLRDTQEVSELILLIKICKDYIDKSLKLRKVITWFEKTYPQKFENLDMDMEDIADNSHLLTTVMQKFQSLLKCEWNNFQMSEIDVDLKNFIDATIKIEETLTNGIEPVNIMDNYDAGWLSPDGEYYALNGEIANMLHTQIADALQEKGLIPMYENENNEKIGIKINPDSWLEQHGWVKIHGNSVHFAGCLNEKLGIPNVDLTDVQIEIIDNYIRDCHGCLIKVGWRLEPLSIGMFRGVAMNLPILYKKYFEY